MYTFIGDCHGKIDTLMRQLQSLHDRKKEGYILQIGDMGLGFSGVKLPLTSGKFGFIRGNHDCPSMCQEHPNYAGEFGMWRDVFVVGGAYSIDWAHRIPGRSWWFNEELSIEQGEEALQQYLSNKPRIVASHEAPTVVAETLLRDGGFRPEKWDSTQSRTARLLQRMFSQHQPEHWVFGHYHRSWQLTLEGTKFQCLNELEATTIC
jgi:hypothetical protein